MRLPVNVRNPRITSATMALIRKAVSCAGFSVKPRKYSAVPTSPAASPPNACERAVRCGTAVKGTRDRGTPTTRSEEHTSELQSLRHLVCRLLLEKKKKKRKTKLINH